MRTKLIIPLLLGCSFVLPGTAHAKELNRKFTAILSAYVKDGGVDYKSLRKDPRLKEYCDQLAQTDPQTLPSDKARLAFWINAYNAYTLKLICENYPIKSINDLSFGGLYLGTVLKKTIWDKPVALIDHQLMTLNTIEHKIIRPLFKDPRVHFALVCGARSCPPLRSEAYEEDKLDDQLNDQGRRFLNSGDKNTFDPERKVAYVSSIFSWFARDFGRQKKDLLLFLSQFVPEDIARAIKKEPGQWKIRYKAYDWSLNE